MNRWLWKYGLAFALLAVAVGLRFVIDPLVGDNIPLATIFVAVILSEWFGGIGPATMVAFLGYVAGNFFFMEPHGQLTFEHPLQGELPQIYAYLISCAVVIGFGETLRLNRRRARESEQQLSEELKRKDDFLAMLAHELRGPLAPISNMLEVLRHADGNVEMIQRSREMIERQLVQLVRLVDDLLDFSRISLHKLDLQRHPIDLAQIVGQAASAVQPFVNSRNQHLILSVPEDRYYLNADPVRLTQIFNNLLHNASKFTGHGGQIILSVRDEGNEVIVYVTDNGIGIPPERLADVFEPFVQLKNAPDNHHGGLGIGLAMVRQLVELHGGNVKAHSKGLGTGSEFVVRLPLLATKPSLNDVTSPGKLSGSSRPLRVLVVDDDEDTADSLTTLLKIDGYDARCAYEGLEALEVGRSFRPHVVLLDIGLPGFSGYDAARRIREQPWGAQLLLIALTGWAQQKDREQSKKAGFDFHFAKPLDPVVLREILEAAAVNDRP